MDIGGCTFAIHICQGMPSQILQKNHLNFCYAQKSFFSYRNTVNSLTCICDGTVIKSFNQIEWMNNLQRIIWCYTKTSHINILFSICRYHFSLAEVRVCKTLVLNVNIIMKQLLNSGKVFSRPKIRRKKTISFMTRQKRYQKCFLFQQKW